MSRLLRSDKVRVLTKAIKYKIKKHQKCQASSKNQFQLTIDNESLSCDQKNVKIQLARNQKPEI